MRGGQPLNERELDALLRWSHKRCERPDMTKAERLVIRLLHHGYMPTYAAEAQLVTEPTAPVEEW